MSIEAPSGPLPAGLDSGAFASVFQAVAGLRNRKAIVALLGCAVAGVLLGGLLVALSGSAGFLFSFLGGLVYLVAIFTGINAAGLLQMDVARGLPPRPLVDALVGGLMCIPKLIVLGLALLVVEIGVFIVLAILLLICKIPFLGPLLFVVIFPLSVVVAGITVCGLFLCAALSLPALWQGLPIVKALTQTLAIARSRLVETVLLLVFLGVLCFFVSMVVFGVLAAGFLPTVSMTAGMLGFGGGMGSASAMMMGGGGGGIVVAGMIGGAVLWAIAAALVGQVYLLGLSLVYLRVTEGIDLAGAEAALRGGIDAARKRAPAMSERTDVMRSPAPPAAPDAPIVPVAAAAAAGLAVAASERPGPPPEPASFEAMQSAAFGGPLATDTSRAETTQPMTYTPTQARPDAADIDLFFDEPAKAAVDLPLESSSTGSIDLPFDDDESATIIKPPPSFPPATTAPALATTDAGSTAPAAPTPKQGTPAYASPPEWMPPPVQAAPPVPPAAPALPPVTTCPQCLSGVAAGDVFCGVCGFRLK